MSGRQRRSWENKQEEMHPAEVHSNVSHGSSPKWSNSEVNDGMMQDNLSGRQSWDHLEERRNDRERHRIQTYMPFSEREPQYRTHDRRGGSARMTRDRDRTMSPDQSRSRSKGRGGVRVRGVSRSRSRSRSRDWENTRARSRSPYYDDRRESNAYMNVKNNFRLSSRRPDYIGGSSRYDDYERDDRNPYDQNQRRQSTRNSRIPCRFFAAGNCNRDDCKFSHDLNPSNISKSNFVEKEKKPWNGPLWADVEPQGVNEMSHNDNKNRTSWDFHDVWKPKTNPSFDSKKGSWDGPSWADVEPRPPGFNEKSRDECLGHSSDDKEIISWDFPDVGKLKSNPNSNDKNRTSWDLPDVVKPKSNPNLDDENRTSWDFPDVMKPKSNPNFDENRTWNGPSWGEVSSSGFSHLSKPVMNAKTDNNVDAKGKEWNGWLQDEVSEPGHSDVGNTSWGDGPMADVPRDNVIVVNNSDSNNDSKVTKDGYHQVLTSEKDATIQGGTIHDMNSRSLCFNGTEHSQHTLLSNPFNGPKVPLNGQDIQEGEKPLELDVPQVKNDPGVNRLPESLPEMPQKLPQLYTELNLANAIDFLQSLPNSSAYNQDTIPKVQPDSAASMETKTGVGNPGGTESIVAENSNKQEQGDVNAEGKTDEGDERATRQFKVALVEFVKEILKPKWKEGKLSREVHKTVVKKVLDKITSTIQGNQIPRTQSKIEQYLSCSKPKITKLVEAYVEKYLKA